jgi:peptide/nickel transport system permease protein
MRTILRRLGFYVLAALAALTLNFFLLRMLPGDPLGAQLAKSTGQITPAELQGLEKLYGVGTHRSLLSQYTAYLGQLLHGNLGTSTAKSVPVTTLISTDLPWTLGLIGCATAVAFVVGTLIGVLAGWRRSGLLDALLPASTFFQAMPYFILSWLLLITVGFYGGLLPYSNGYDVSRGSTVTPGWNASFVGSVISHGALPATAIALASVAGWITGMRNMMITTMDEDYVLVAAAKGLPQWRVAAVAARNALLPSISNFALSISLVVTGSIVTEIVFSYPGLGNEINTAIQNTDYPVLQGILIVVVFTVLAANFLADLVYVALDPRARKEA